MIQFNVEVMICLVIAHLLGDFVFQTKKDVENKKNVKVLLKHSLNVTFLSLLFLGSIAAWWIAIIIGVTHFLIDLIKIRIGKKPLQIFILDQIAHLAILIIIAGIIDKISSFAIFWTDLLGNDYYKILLVVSALILIIRVGGIIIGLIVAPLLEQIEKQDKKPVRGLENGGMWIGSLERILIFLLVIFNIPSAVGFLIAAKSFLRFGELKETQNRMEAEYIIIGTFLSFAWALLVSYGLLEVINYY